MSSDESDIRKQILAKALSSFQNFCAILTVNSKEVGKGLVPFRLNTIQRAYIDAMTRRDIILKPRQVGMTTLLLAYDIFLFLTKKGANVFIVCQSKVDNSPLNGLCSEISRHFKRLETELGLKIDFSKKVKGQWNFTEMGSKLSVVVAGASDESAKKLGRSGMISHLHCTEVAFWDRPEESWGAISGCLPAEHMGSSVVMESTPNGASGLFCDMFRRAVAMEGQFKAHFFPWFVQSDYRIPLLPGEKIVPSNDLELRLEPEQIKWYRTESHGKPLFIQEYPSDPDSCFLAQGRSFFDNSKILGMLAKASDYEAPMTFEVGQSGLFKKSSVIAKEIPRRTTMRVFQGPREGSRYVLALDPSEGVGLDACAGILLERGTGAHVGTLWGQLRPEQLAAAAVKIALEYNGALIATERQNHGHAVRVALTTGYKDCGLKAPYPHLFFDSDKNFGWLNTIQSRTLALDLLDQAIRIGEPRGFYTRDIWLLRELQGFIVTETASGKTRADHGRGKHDDLVMALAIAWSVVCRRQVHRDLRALPPA